MSNIQKSYTAAGVFPIKLLHMDVFRNNAIFPMHLQLNPTNACNLECDFCSCANREHDAVQPFEEIKELLLYYAALGMRAVTITGGGEPLLHPRINDILALLNMLHIGVGLVTNGTVFDRLESSSEIDWIRVSFSDDRDPHDKFLTELVQKRDEGQLVTADWSFSYVLTRKPDYDKLRTLVKFADTYRFSHVRLVSDLLDLEGVPDMADARAELRLELGQGLVIYQGRKQYTRGHKYCRISLLKPVIDVHGDIYPCCGVQYALADPSRDYESTMKMGHWREAPRIYDNQEYFDGSDCVRCYYNAYNELLDMMTSGVVHPEFV